MVGWVPFAEGERCYVLVAGAACGALPDARINDRPVCQAHGQLFMRANGFSRLDVA